MKNYIFILLLIISVSSCSQKIERIDVPERVVYKYCNPEILKNAENLIRKELSTKSEGELVDKILFVGPILWTRFSEIESLANIEEGKMTLLLDDKQLTGKMTRDINDSKLIWEQVKKEVNGLDYKLRKATYEELDYYWTVISFDIVEPLIILETSEHKYILDIAPSTLKLLWIDEVPN